MSADPVPELGAEGPLPDAVRLRVVALASDALGSLTPEEVPGPLARVADFAPQRRAKLAGSRIAGLLATDDAFREAVAGQVRIRLPELAHALASGEAPGAADPVEVAAVAYLTRSPGWDEVVRTSAERLDAERDSVAGRQAAERVDRLRQQLEDATRELKETRRRHREQLDALKAENAQLRHKLGDARTRAREAAEEADHARAAAAEAGAAASSSAVARDSEVRRLRQRIDELEAEVASARRTEREGRDVGTLRARLLMDTLLDAAQGLRRELALPTVEGSPADLVTAEIAAEGARAPSGHSSLALDDPALLEQLLAMPRAHLVVDGYNVTKTSWPDMPLSGQRDRLLDGLAPLSARTRAEITVVFDAAATEDRPPVTRPRGVRVLYSPVGVIADDVIRELVAAEPTGRPVVVVSSDQAVARDVRRDGARVVAATALSRLLSRG
ncbi:MAG: RNA-binding protein [Nocardioidaceae bacterium]|nr:RNA-binding protein [Nocardioidaceae bacterium]